MDSAISSKQKKKAAAIWCLLLPLIHHVCLYVFVQVKCDHYWPFSDEPIMYGEVSVEMLSESEAPEWTVRKFRLGYVSFAPPSVTPKPLTSSRHSRVPPTLHSLCRLTRARTCCISTTPHGLTMVCPLSTLLRAFCSLFSLFASRPTAPRSRWSFTAGQGLTSRGSFCHCYLKLK